ncbi:MAG TPA: formate dehydrogenase accessory protein FdhE [Terriglobales bacterium]
MIRSRWDQRIQRADELATAHPFAAEVLVFYKRSAILQKSLYARFEPSAHSEKTRLAQKLSEIDPEIDLLLAEFPAYLSQLATFAAKPIAGAARRLQAGTPDQWRELLVSEWRALGDISIAPESVIIGIFLRPYVEFLADQSERAPSTGASPTCPFCQSKPVVGALRPEGDGGKRFLTCGFCATEWPFNRLLCASCGETHPDKLPVYTASQFPHVRVEACDTCLRYIKTVDLTRNGRAVPIVDELATLPLNLWAEEHQYTKLRPNLLGM